MLNFMYSDGGLYKVYRTSRIMYSDIRVYRVHKVLRLTLW